MFPLHEKSQRHPLIGDKLRNGFVHVCYHFITPYVAAPECRVRSPPCGHPQAPRYLLSRVCVRARVCACHPYISPCVVVYLPVPSAILQPVSDHLNRFILWPLRAAFAVFSVFVLYLLRIWSAGVVKANFELLIRMAVVCHISFNTLRATNAGRMCFLK